MRGKMPVRSEMSAGRREHMRGSALVLTLPTSPADQRAISHTRRSAPVVAAVERLVGTISQAAGSAERPPSPRGAAGWAHPVLPHSPRQAPPSALLLLPCQRNTWSSYGYSSALRLSWRSTARRVCSAGPRAHAAGRQGAKQRKDVSVLGYGNRARPAARATQDAALRQHRAAGRPTGTWQLPAPERPPTRRPLSHSR